MKTFANPMRSAILYELTRRGECSATDLAKILDQKVNNIYYHLRILENDSILNPPRSVVKRNYVEKYYSLDEKFMSVNVDKQEWKRSQQQLSPEQRRQIAITTLNLIISILRWRVEDYKRMSSEEIDQLWKKEWVTLSTFTQEQYEDLVKRLEKTWLETMQEFHRASPKKAKPFTVIITALAAQPLAPWQ
jgi:DNA-binding transcriptional ArsR family regulator